MLLDIKKIFGTYDEPVTAALELDLSSPDNEVASTYKRSQSAAPLTRCLSN